MNRLMRLVTVKFTESFQGSSLDRVFTTDNRSGRLAMRNWRRWHGKSCQR